ncbi:nucleoside monophosphate kinase [Patescibacteria group bacterium]|nr:nucleoside monophosphate kinase [Patescibacteria group bacterium]
MTIVVMGPQGSGKSTQAKFLAEEMGLLYVSTGNICREASEKDTAEGRKIAWQLKEGLLPPSDLMTKILINWLDEHGNVKGIVTDGYPRSLENVEDIEEKILPAYGPLEKVIYIDTSKEECLKRLTKRAEIEHRIDETPEAISMRLKLYFERTVPVLDYYREKGLLVKINGNKGIEEIQEDILKIINPQPSITI